MRIRSLFFLIATLLFCAVASAQPKKIGVSIPLSGMAAGYGTAFQGGLELFKEEHPEHAASFSFLIDDHAYDGARVVSSVRKLAGVDRCSLVFVWGAMPSDVAAPLSSQIGVPLMLETFDPKGKDRPAVFAFDLPLPVYRELMKELVSRNRIKTMGVVGTNIGAAVEFLNLVRPDLPPLAYEETVAADALDFNSTVTKIRAKPVDAMLLLLSPQQIDIFVQQAAAQGYRARIVSGDLLADDALRSKVKRAMGAVSYMYGGVDGGFKERYARRFGNTSYIFEAASGYAFGVLMQRAAAGLGTLSAAEYVKNLPGLGIPESPVGPIKFELSPERGMHAQLRAVVYDE